jgi:hypothetical protein
MVGSVFLLMKLMEQTPSEEMIIEIRTKQDVASPAPNP